MSLRVAITGVAGLIGSIARAAALTQGAEVVGIDLPVPVSNIAEHCPDVSVVDVALDVGAADDLEALCNAFQGVDTVIHLAGTGNITADMPTVMHANCMGTHNVLQAAARAGSVRKVIFASTNHRFLGLRSENGRLATLRTGPQIKLGGEEWPNSFYAVSKTFGESLLRLYSAVQGHYDGIAVRIGWIQFDDPAKAPLPLSWDTPAHREYLRAVWLSKRDAHGYFQALLALPLPDCGGSFNACWATSNNGHAVFDLDETVDFLKYRPQDNAEDFFVSACHSSPNAKDVQRNAGAVEVAGVSKTSA